NPMMKALNSLLIEDPLFIAEEIRPFQCPKIRELRTLEQAIDQASAFVLEPVIHETTRLFSGGQHAEKIKISTTQENRIGAQTRRIGSQRSQFGEHLLVDIVVHRSFCPFEI